jgi:hypothetical protein
MTTGNESLDPRRTATAPIAGLNATKMFLQYQACGCIGATTSFGAVVRKP